MIYDGRDPGDSDFDLLADAWEMENFASLRFSDGNNDSDGDGVSDFDEYSAGTNPKSLSSRFVVGVLSGQAGTIELFWRAVPEREYSIVHAESANGPFSEISPESIETDGKGIRRAHIRRIDAAAGFYQIRVHISQP